MLSLLSSFTEQANASCVIMTLFVSKQNKTYLLIYRLCPLQSTFFPPASISITLVRSLYVWSDINLFHVARPLEAWRTSGMFFGFVCVFDFAYRFCICSLFSVAFVFGVCVLYLVCIISLNAAFFCCICFQGLFVFHFIICRCFLRMRFWPLLRACTCRLPYL